MKFAINKNVLLENLNNVVRGISTKNVIPILNGIKFELTNDGLTLMASDSELTIETFISKDDILEINNTGTIIISSKYILDIIRKMPSEVINFEMQDSLKIRIYSDFNQYDLNALDPNDYPSIKLISHKDPIVIKASILKELINQTSFAISTQELRPILTGLNIKINGDYLECIATDSYRLAKKNIKLDSPTLLNVDIVIPGKNVSELEHILDDDSDVLMNVFNNRVLFEYKNIKFQTNILSGNYPNTSNLIPNEFEIIIQTNKEAFIGAVDRAALLTLGKEKNIIKMNVDKQEMIIRSSASEIGKAEEKINIETSPNASIDISFSARYMIEALKTIKDDDILILLNNDVKPIVIKSLKDESLIQLILPIKTY